MFFAYQAFYSQCHQLPKPFFFLFSFPSSIIKDFAITLSDYKLKPDLQHHIQDWNQEPHHLLTEPLLLESSSWGFFFFKRFIFYMTSAANISQDNVKLFFGVILDNSEPRLKPWSSYSDTTSPPTELLVPSSKPPYFVLDIYLSPDLQTSLIIMLNCIFLSSRLPECFLEPGPSPPPPTEPAGSRQHPITVAWWCCGSHRLDVSGFLVQPWLQEKFHLLHPPWRSVLECAVIWNEGVAYSINKTHNEKHLAWQKSFRTFHIFTSEFIG